MNPLRNTPLPPRLAAGVRRLGFRKWYERELMQSHAHLLLLFICSIGLLTSFGIYSAQAQLVDRLIDVAAILAEVARR